MPSETFNVRASKANLEVIEELLAHIQYLGDIGASRNILVRVDGDGMGRISVSHRDPNYMMGRRYNIDQDKHKNYGANPECNFEGYDFSPCVGVYDIE